VATTATAGKHIAEGRRFSAALRSRFGNSFWPKPGVRARQIALITLLVSLVVLTTTIANIAYITGGIIKRIADQATQVSNQITYAVQQELAQNADSQSASDRYSAIAGERSGVRGVMESTIATPGPITYLYLTDEDGKILTDRRGRNDLALNQHMIRGSSYDLRKLNEDSAYVQLAQVFLGPATYDYHEALSDDSPIAGELHIGVSAAAIRRELRSPIQTNIFIGLLAIVGAALVALTSANLLLKPLEAISTSIDQLQQGEDEQIKLPQDEVVQGVTARLRQLGARLAGERSELEIMRGRLRQVISHLEERLLLINREGRVILASPDAERLLLANSGELAGLPIDESLGHNHPLVRLVERSFQERRPIARVTLDVPGSPGPRRLLASVQYIEDAGEPVGALVSLRDFESFQKFESQWDLSKKLADLGRITSGIAHEVKNPLNAMVIHLEILKSKLETEGTDPTPQIEILDSEIRRLDRVVQTFLNFTRPVEVRLDPLDLNAIVEQVVALAATEAEGWGVTITRDPAPGPLVVKGDSDLLKQALLNVIMNGCQAMPEGGPLTITTSAGADGSARISVKDRGVGISAEARDRIFNLYYTTKAGGSGIGLAQAFRAVQLHNGEIKFDSAEGVGTTFDIVLPASR
jgi:signal transduction histidine kinase